MLANLACRRAVKSRIPSKYFAFSRIPDCILVKSRIPEIPFLTLTQVVSEKKFLSAPTYRMLETFECFHSTWLILVDVKHLYFRREQLLFFLWEINCFLKNRWVFAYSRTTCFSTLKTRSSRLETRDSRLEPRTLQASRIESRGSSFECQLSFERYCKRTSMSAMLCNVVVVDIVRTHLRAIYRWRRMM